MTATLSPAEDVQTTAPRHGVQRVENRSQLICCCARAAFSLITLLHWCITKMLFWAFAELTLDLIVKKSDVMTSV